MNNEKKIKFIISVSIFLILTLFISSIVLSICIFNKENEIKKQEEEIEKLNHQIDYYEKNSNANISTLFDFIEVDL